MNLWDIPERPDLEARIAELEAELEQARECELDVNRAMRKRLAAVIALCDDMDRTSDADTLMQVRAAATGDPT